MRDKMRTFLICLFLLVCNLALANPPNPFTGKVVKVSDGDTIKVLHGDTKYSIRLAEIDAPERKQVFGEVSKLALTDKIFGKDVKIEWEKKDRYGRIIGQVYLEQRWINKEMVFEGYAWHYKAFSKSKDIAVAESEAKTEKRGLWIEMNPLPPWEFRKRK